jgi:hypothetical protein
MESQEQCDRMKQLCIDNGLPIWDDKMAFELPDDGIGYFGFDDEKNRGDNEFFIFEGIGNDLKGKTLITESEFIELLKQEKA